MSSAAKSLSVRYQNNDNHAQRSTRPRGNSEDNHSLLTQESEHSSKSKASDACSRASPSNPRPKTANPANKSEPMPFPVGTEGGNHVYLREHINSATSVAECLPTITPTSFFRLDSGLPPSSDNVSIFEKNRPFAHGPANPYKFDRVAFEAYRVIMTDLITHWRGGLRVDRDVILWLCWTAAFRSDFL